MKTFCAALKKYIDFFVVFSPKIDGKSSPKVRKTPFARKIDKKPLPDIHFWFRDRFLVDFGVPEGTPKLLKINAPFWVKGSWEPSGSHFGWLSILFLILVHFWSILAPFWLILAPFSNIFGCLLFAFFGGTSVFFWVVGLLCS